MLKKTNNNGFTLVEVIAAIVILGIVMNVIVSNVTQYIADSKKEAYIRTLSNYVESLKYDVAKGKYNLDLGDSIKIPFSSIKMRDEENLKSTYGNYVDDYSYVTIFKDKKSNYNYSVQALDDAGYYILDIDIQMLSKSDILKSEYRNGSDNIPAGLKVNTQKKYVVGEKITFKGYDWHVIEDSPELQTYVIAIKDDVISAEELRTLENNDLPRGTSTMVGYYIGANCHSANVRDYTTANYTGCKNTYTYGTVRTLAEHFAKTYLGFDNLKKIGLHSIRLITNDEYNRLNQNATYSSWLNRGVSYWTMSVHTDSSLAYIVKNVNGVSQISTAKVGEAEGSVKPVIHLLKSSIQN